MDTRAAGEQAHVALKPTVMEEIASADASDRVWVRWSIGVAVVLHLILFVIQWPVLVDATEKPRTRIHDPIVVHIQYPPPRQPEELQLQRPRTRMVPIPDPDPFDPEPIRELGPAPDPGPELDDDTVWARYVPPPPPPEEPEEHEVLLVGGEVTKPVQIGGVEPRYPEAARAVRMEGIVILSCVIDRTGRVQEIEVLRDGPLGMTAAAVDAVRTWTFRPGELHGRPVDVRYVLTVRFGLE
jgi:protein TonB